MAVSLTWIRDRYDVNKNRYVDGTEADTSREDWVAGTISDEQYLAVIDAYNAHTLLPAYDTPPPMETRTVSLTEGQHTIQVSLTGYDTLQATINVSSTGVTCVSVVGGACGGTGLPRVSTSGWTVTTYLKTGVPTTNRCTWIATQDLSKVAFISEMVLAHLLIPGTNIGFTPSAEEIGNGVLMYLNIETPAIWGC